MIIPTEIYLKITETSPGTGGLCVQALSMVISVTWHFIGMLVLVWCEMNLWIGYVAHSLSRCCPISVLWVGGSGVLWGKVSGRSRHRRS